MRTLNFKEKIVSIIVVSIIAGAFFAMDAICGTTAEIIVHGILYLASLVFAYFILPKHYIIIEKEAINTKTGVVYSSGGYWIKNYSDFREFPLPFMINVAWGVIEIFSTSYLSKNDIEEIIDGISQINVEHLFTAKREFQGTNVEIFMLEDEINAFLANFGCELRRICSMSLKGTIPNEFKRATKIRFSA